MAGDEADCRVPERSAPSEEEEKSNKAKPAGVLPQQDAIKLAGADDARGGTAAALAARRLEAYLAQLPRDDQARGTAAVEELGPNDLTVSFRRMSSISFESEPRRRRNME